MIILGIESSCDDTSVALVKGTDDGFEILVEKTASQIDIHKKYGGVVPEIAGRAHAENITPLIEEIMQGRERPDAIAVTSGPGLMTGLLVGIQAAKTLSYLWDVPLVGVNHIDGHIHSVEIDSPITLPAVALTVSGGHTELILMHGHGDYELIGKTRDDAAGEAFDKIAKLLGLDYPGGPKISAFAEKGNPNAITFTRPMLGADNFDFSFSGLKTAALYHLRDNAKKSGNTYALGEKERNDFCASFQQAIVDVLTQKMLRAVKKYSPASVILAGGVSANRLLRDTIQTILTEKYPFVSFFLSPMTHAMDNAAMIAIAGYYSMKKGQDTNWRHVSADPNWKVYDEHQHKRD